MGRPGEQEFGSFGWGVSSLAEGIFSRELQYNARRGFGANRDLAGGWGLASPFFRSVVEENGHLCYRGSLAAPGTVLQFSSLPWVCPSPQFQPISTVPAYCSWDIATV